MVAVFFSLAGGADAFGVVAGAGEAAGAGAGDAAGAGAGEASGAGAGGDGGAGCAAGVSFVAGAWAKLPGRPVNRAAVNATR